MCRFAQNMVKFAILGSGQECGDLCLSVEQDRAYRETRVPHGDLAARQRGQLHARAVGITVLALLPADLAELAGGHPVVHHDRPSSPSGSLNASGPWESSLAVISS